MLQAVKGLLATCASRDVTLVEVEHGEHELFMGKHWEAITSSMAKWMLDQAAKRQ